MSTQAALAVEDLTVRYGAATAVDGIWFTGAAGEVTALLGPNGAGKTSTVEVISGLRRPTSGRATVLGQAPDDPAVRARMGVMLQLGGLFPTARPLEWLQYLARLYPGADDPRALLELVGIDPGTRTTARRMSGGEQQRVKLAAALLPRPDVLLLDEPTAGLDPLARRNLLDTIRQRRDEGAAILLTTHVLADVEDLADHVVVLSEGRILARGTVGELTGTDDALAFTTTPGLDVASLARALPDGYAVQEPDAGRYVVHGEPTPQVVAAIAAWCGAQGVMVGSLQAGRRTLEDILVEAARRQP